MLRLWSLGLWDAYHERSAGLGLFFPRVLGPVSIYRVFFLLVFPFWVAFAPLRVLLHPFQGGALVFSGGGRVKNTQTQEA